MAEVLVNGGENGSQESKRPRTEPPREATIEIGGRESRDSPDVSVLMPCRNAMPWLPDCVASILAQEGVSVELIAVDDGSTDASLAWLRDCEAACHSTPTASGTVSAVSSVGAEGMDTKEGGGRLGWVGEHYTPPTATQVAAKRKRNNTLRVLSVTAYGPSGQGLALNAALRHARAPLIGEMESDDLRPPHTFATLAAELACNSHLDAVASQVKLVGWPRDGMERYIQWQNSQMTEEEMAGSRFVEIPALRASALYRRECMLKLRGYRDLWDVDGVVKDFAASAEHLAFLDAHKDKNGSGAGAEAEWMGLTGWWPVDSDFWMRFFAAGMRCRKIAKPLYEWRQYPAQSTRTHSRCSIPQLRSCKIHFLTCPGGPLHGKGVQVWSIGQTLTVWGEDLQRAGIKEVELITCKPGAQAGQEGGITAQPPLKDSWVRIFIYGAEKARKKIKNQKVILFDASRDWFAA